MAGRNVIVGVVSRIDPVVQLPGSNFLSSTPTGVTVHFDNGQTARVNPQHPASGTFIEMLDEMRRTSIPAYVEVDVSGAISDLLIPHTVRVRQIGAERDGEIEVRLEISHARHVLKRSNPAFDELRRALGEAEAQQATVLVTENDTHEIIDVRPAPHPKMPAPGQTRPRHPAETTLASKAITRERAQELFTRVNRQSCDRFGAAGPCIPFLYPDDGCWVRAHEMCRLMLEDGAQPEKIWIYGRLLVKTPNNPGCQVEWNWHVAPTLQVSVGAGSERQVVDPSMFDQPVPEATWKSAQGDLEAELAYTDASAFYRERNGESIIDPAYHRTARGLEEFRLELKNRAGKVGPPPYATCQ